jgi:hypothetical protein
MSFIFFSPLTPRPPASFQADRFSMASCYGPICASTVPLLVFRRQQQPSSSFSSSSGADAVLERASGSGWELVATGALSNVEPDRIMLKKVRSTVPFDAA